MMRKPYLWPCKVLYLKNYALAGGKGAHWPLFGVLTYDKKGFHFLEEEKEKGRDGDDALLVELVKEGWLVD